MSCIVTHLNPNKRSKLREIRIDTKHKFWPLKWCENGDFKHFRINYWNLPINFGLKIVVTFHLN